MTLSIPEIIKEYEKRFLEKRQNPDGSLSEYIHLKGTALERDFRNFLTSTLTHYRSELIEEMMPEEEKSIPEEYQNPFAEQRAKGYNTAIAEMRRRAEKITTPTI